MLRHPFFVDKRILSGYTELMNYPERKVCCFMKMPGFPDGYIASSTFGFDVKRDDCFKEDVLRSMEIMKEQTNANAVILAFIALQSDNNSVDIDYVGPHIPDEAGLERLVKKARELDMRVIFKPMLNCRNGMWRGTINFFDKETPPEYNWSEWFENYTKFQVHFAKIAERLGVEMICIACEMVSTQRRDADWRKCIAEIRKHYSGPLTWNADKYQEDEVTFWDALDVISTSGYYPIDKWDQELTRIKKVVDRFKKPFFFAEYGCMTCKDTLSIPNNPFRFGRELARVAAERGVSMEGVPMPYGVLRKPGQWKELTPEQQQLYLDVVDQDAQAEFYRVSFEACERYPFVQGFGLWDWAGNLNTDPEDVPYNGGYSIYNKKAAEVVKEYFTKKGYTPIDDLSEPTPEEKCPAKAYEVLNERFGHNTDIALATVEGGHPAVRTVSAYYEDGAFYVITNALSNKMRQIRCLPNVAISGDWFTANGVGENLGHVLLPENAELLDKLSVVFAEWYGEHVDECDENTVILKIRLTDGILFDHGTRYDITF